MNNSNLGPVKIAKVVIDGAGYDFDKVYDYIVPVELEDKTEVGKRVEIPFGRSNRKKIGLILKIENHEKIDQLPYFTKKGLAIKPIINVIDERVMVSDEMIKIAIWLKSHTFCRYFDAIKMMIPSGYNMTLSKKYKLSEKAGQDFGCILADREKQLLEILRSGADGKNIIKNALVECLSDEDRAALGNLIRDGYILEREVLKRKIQDSKLVMVALDAEACDLSVESKDFKLTEKQRKVIEFLKSSQSASLKEVIYMCGVTKTVLDNLVKKEIIRYFEVETYRRAYNFDEVEFFEDITLNSQQKEVFDGLVRLVDEKKQRVALIQGITGSGKTLIFIELIRYVLGLGRKVILLVPEISLTPQMVNMLGKYFGAGVAVLHSGLTLASRLDEWKRIKNGEASVVLGTRSAIFAPVDDIGLIIMDEEQEESYKSGHSPRYHARDIAMIRSKFHGSLFLMASATPSVETYYKMKKNNLSIFHLDRRYNEALLPQVSIVDMGKEKADGNNTFFSRELILSIEERLDKGQQSIIFINRRGYNTVIRCDECGYIEKCPNCDIALIYHKANNRLMCHYCGYVKEAVKKCGNCDSVYLKYDGAGTQKLESQLEEIFPKARILRLDTDKIMDRFSYDKYFNAFLNHEYDILIGTQMIAKGLNFPNVTLVGVIDVDRSIYSSDYKGFERTYDLVTQVIGRSGRGNISGKAIIQTSDRSSDLFDLVLDQKYDSFYQREILARKRLAYPPFCDMAELCFVGSDELKLIEVGNECFELIKELVLNQFKDLKLKMFGPVSEVISKVNNKYRYKISLKYKDSKMFREMINIVLIKMNKRLQKLDISIFIDKI